MRYWAYFVGKLTTASVLLYGLLALLGWALPQLEDGDPRLTRLNYGGQVLLLNVALMVWFLLCAGALYLIVHDQRYRCRTCLRRLRMPIGTGSWGQMLQLGRPQIEYICPYGHGTLKQAELQISGLENPEWTRNSGDMWEELCASSKEAGKES